MDKPKTGSVIKLVQPGTPREAWPPKIQSLFEEVQAIELEDARAAGTVGYMARTLVQATLPYREPKGDVPAWGRRSGDVSLMIQPGYYFEERPRKGSRGGTEQVPVNIGYPYGSIPRLLLAWLSTEVTRKKDREILLGNSLSEFMDALGLFNHTGGARGSITRLREMMKRLFAARIVITTDPQSVDWNTASFAIADKATVWWDPQNPRQAGLFESSVVLTERFYQELVDCPVPIDLRILSVLRASPMALDLYCWLTYRMFALKKPTIIPWRVLQDQFGSEATNTSKFREAFRRNLAMVNAVYPVNVDPKTRGVILMPSKTSVTPLIQIARSR